MKFWQSLAFVEVEQVIELAVFCEDLGFHGVSCGDHLVTTQEQADAYLYRDDGNVFWNPETHWPDPWVLAAAVAQATTRLQFLSTIYILPLRDPFSAAKAVSTAACLSNNRVSLGVGVGWQKAEFELVGQDFHTRGKRCDESLQIMRQLMSGESCDFEGRFYHFPPLQMSPGTTVPVPIMVGGYSPAAMSRAARYDGWMATTHREEELYPLLRQIQDIRDSQGNPDQHFDIWSGIIAPESGTHERLEAAGLTMCNGTNFLGEDGRTTLSGIDDKKRRLEDFAKRFF